MFKKALPILLLAGIPIALASCDKTVESSITSAAVSESTQIETTTSEETTTTEMTAQSESTSKAEKMTMKINEQSVEVEWEENDSVNALKEMAKSSPVVIKMSKYGGFEQVGSIGKKLPAKDRRIKTNPGDIVLYSRDQIVVFYGNNTWEYTMLGKIKGKSKEELKKLLGSSDVTLTISFE